MDKKTYKTYLVTQRGSQRGLMSYMLRQEETYKKYLVTQRESQGWLTQTETNNRIYVATQDIFLLLFYTKGIIIWQV